MCKEMHGMIYISPTARYKARSEELELEIALIPLTSSDFGTLPNTIRVTYRKSTYNPEDDQSQRSQP